MAEKGQRQYNICSVLDSVQLPVQIHMASDAEFLSKLSKSQQNSDADESEISDLNCSALVESSDDEQNPCGRNIRSTSSTLSMLPGASTLSDVATQQAINVQILAQLSSISDRLNTLEKKDVKKDLDPKKKKSSLKKKTDTHAALVTLPQHQCPSLTLPNLQSIRQDAFIQSQVDQILKELTNSDNAGTKLNLIGGSC